MVSFAKSRARARAGCRRATLTRISKTLEPTYGASASGRASRARGGGDDHARGLSGRRRRMRASASRPRAPLARVARGQLEAFVRGRGRSRTLARALASEDGRADAADDAREGKIVSEETLHSRYVTVYDQFEFEDARVLGTFSNVFGRFRTFEGSRTTWWDTRR